MTFDPRIERVLPSVLADLGSGPAPDYTEFVLERTSRIRQRPAWTFPERWLPLGVTTAGPLSTRTRWSLIIVAALLAIALVAAALFAGVGRQSRLPAPFGPAANGAIVYGEAGDIYEGDPTTGATRAIIAGPTYDFRPGYSPDGSLIAFLRRVDPATSGKTDIVVAHTDGSGARVVTIEPLAIEPANWSWAPDSRSITLVTSNDSSAQFEVFDTRTPGPPRIVSQGVTVDPPWAFQPPDGNRILFRGHVGSRIGLYTMGLDGSGLVPLIAPFTSPVDQIDLTFSTWSPDGKRIVFQRVSADGTSMGLYVMNADGTDPLAVGYTTGDVSDGWPVWSPDGTRIAFQRARGDTTSGGYGLYTWAVVDLSSRKVIPTGPVLDVDTVVEWSPDSKKLLVIYVVPGRPQLILDPDGGPAQEVPWAPFGGDWQRKP